MCFFFCRQRKQVVEIGTTEGTGRRMTTETQTERDTETETMTRSEKGMERGKRSVE